MIWNRFRKQPSRLVAVVVPMSCRVELTPEEEVSMRHLLHFLGKYDKYLVVSKTLRVNFPGFKNKRFSNKFFGSVKAHNRLLLSPIFYKAFSEYKFILIYHLDSLVFSDQLTQWCEKDFDYIAPPWIRHADAPYVGNPAYEDKVGNGGFSLRKIKSFLKVMYSPKYYMEPDLYWQRYCESKSKIVQYINYPRKILKQLKYRNTARWERSNFSFNEERFIANRAAHYYPDFNIAPLDTALQFAFECVPRYCFEKNNSILPFGCHAWHYYDREFWEQYLIRNGVTPYPAK